jgi:uncharacterized protein (DUF2267 family)
MSEQGLETIESSTQKAYEWIARLAEGGHLEKRDAYKALRAVLQTLRDRLPLDDAVHFGAQLPLLIRGLYYEGWEPSKVPVKMSREEFLAAISDKIVTDKVIDPVRITGCVLEVISGHVAPGETEKLRHCFPKALQTLWPQSGAAL